MTRRTRALAMFARRRTVPLLAPGPLVSFEAALEEYAPPLYESGPNRWPARWDGKPWLGRSAVSELFGAARPLLDS